MIRTRPFTFLALGHDLPVVPPHKDERVGLDGGHDADWGPVPGLVQQVQVGGLPLGVVAGAEEPGWQFNGNTNITKKYTSNFHDGGILMPSAKFSDFLTHPIVSILN